MFIAELVDRRVKRNDLRVDRQLTQASRDQLRVLRAKIQYENSLVGHERRYYPTQGLVFRPIHATIFALVVTATLVDRTSPLGAEPKAPQRAARQRTEQQPKVTSQKKIPPTALPLLPIEPQWIALLDSQPSAPGVMDASRVYIPLQPEEVVALDRFTGAKLWTHDVESSWAPVLAADTLYIAASDELHAL